MRKNEGKRKLSPHRRIEDDQLYENVIAGRNAVLEGLNSEDKVDAVFVAKGQMSGTILRIISEAKQLGYPVKEVSYQKLDAMAGGVNHQGILLTLSAVQYYTLDDLLCEAKEKEEDPFVIIADEIEDPHNLGALIRTAETAGAHGVIIPKRRNVGVTSAVYKASAGAAAHLPVARVPNLSAAVDELKQRGLWVYGCDMEGQTWCQTDFSGGVAQGRGISRLLKEKCDVLVTLPMKGKITSLNASVAGGVVMYEVARQRSRLKALPPKEY